MQLTDAHRHYHLDAELFDYFEERSGLDQDSTRRLQQSAFRALRKRPGVIIDAGSGNGWLLNEPARSFEVVSVDLGRKNLRRIRELHTNARATCADLTNLPFRNDSVDGVLASEVLEHLNDPGQAVREFSRVCRPGGIVVVTTPYKEALRMYLCVHCNKPTPANAHIQTFDEGRLLELFREAELKEVRYELRLSKLFIGSRLSYLLRVLPFSLWLIADTICMFAYRRAHTIVVTGTKH